MCILLHSSRPLSLYGYRTDTYIHSVVCKRNKGFVERAATQYGGMSHHCGSEGSSSPNIDFMLKEWVMQVVYVLHYNEPLGGVPDKES